MAVTMTHNDELANMATELARLDPLKEDYISDTRRMGFHLEALYEPQEEVPLPAPVPKITLDNPDADGELIEVAVNDHAQQQIGARLGIPRKYWDRMRDNHPDILQDTVRKLFVREPEVRQVRTLEGVARAFLSDRYRALDNYDLMDQSILPALQEAGNDQMVVLGARITDLRIYLKVLFPDVVFADPRPQGGQLHGGIIIGNSEVGAGKLFVDPFMYASFCRNGMVFGQQKFADFGLSKVHIGKQIEDSDQARRMFSDETMRKDDEAFFAMAKDVILNSANGVRFKAMIEEVMRAAGIEVEGDPVMAVERVAKKYDLRETEQKSMMQYLIQGGDLSAWGYANAVTATAQTVKSYDRQVELERVGAVLLGETPGSWKALAASA